jgi:sterol desaturase/sphingolipid hydroxylase (fatty acid hydroxylase superfamily)
LSADIHYFNVVDHSGVYCESWLPWAPSSLYHDDHHRFFHVNYGQVAAPRWQPLTAVPQALTLFDRLGGTFYQPLKRDVYSASTFSDFSSKKKAS